MQSVNLRPASGLPLKLEGHRLIFGAGMKKVAPEARMRERMMAVLKNPASHAPNDFYYMYRDVCMKKDAGKIKAAKLRYDITVLPAFSVGDELNKTFGHYHPMVPGTKTWYPEVYEVLHGRAHYLLQNGKEFLVFDAREGDKCVMLPGFGHITINPFFSSSSSSSSPSSSQKETLVMANWVYPGFASDYGPIEKLGGAQWYETAKGFVENHHYVVVPGIKLVEPKEFPEFGLTKRPLYTEGVKNPKKFEWLSKPQHFEDSFRRYRE